MVFKKNNEKNTQSIENYNVEIDKEMIIEETEKIYGAIKNNNIDLSDSEKNKLINDIQTISNEIDGVNGDLFGDFELDKILNYNNKEASGNLHTHTSENMNINEKNYLEKNSNQILEKSMNNNKQTENPNTQNHKTNNKQTENPNTQNHKTNNKQTFEEYDVNDALNNLIDDYSEEVAIKVDNIYMDYKLSKDKIDTLKEFFIRTIKRNKSKSKTITALKDISFEIPKGDRVGIIGFNGAGKSTLLKLLAGIYDPTSGTIKTKGKIAPLLELGAGFDDNYTGKANIFLNGAFLGYSEEFLKEKYDEIVEFSELGDAVNYHIKTYSSGMRAKLGFSIATIVEPDILIIDEILSVGDIKFRRKSADKIRSLINSGVTVLLVSHSVGQIRDLCNKAIWLDNGELKMIGEANAVCDEYVKAASSANKKQLENIELS